MILYDELNRITDQDVSNKLFTTFTTENNINDTLDTILSNYTILYDKVFVLSIKDSDEFVCTYNVDQNNMSETYIMPNTILLHRQKHTNTLYSINAINILIENLNGGVLNRDYKINWEDYRNSILLTRKRMFAQLFTKVHKIFDLSEK